MKDSHGRGSHNKNRSTSTNNKNKHVTHSTAPAIKISIDTLNNTTDSRFTKQQDWFTHTHARECIYRDSIQRIIRSTRFVNKSSAVNETHPVSANTKYTVRDSVVRHTSSTLSRAASLASLRLRVSGIRILRVDSPLRFFIDLIVSVFQWVRASPSARRENARTLPNPSAGSPDPSAPSHSLTHSLLLCFISFKTLSFSISDHSAAETQNKLFNVGRGASRASWTRG